MPEKTQSVGFRIPNKLTDSLCMFFDALAEYVKECTKSEAQDRQARR